jgi:glycosyltransferase involved in cell wall biosynthesis
MNQEVNISVVIPAYNAEKTIGQCLASLYEQSRRPNQIIVVDNNSTDETKKIVLEFLRNQKEIDARCIDEYRRGPSFARNCGANNAQGDVIAFIDADCIADPSWLARLLASFENPDTGAVAGSIIGFDKETTIGKFHALFTLMSLPKSGLFNEFNLISGGFPTANFSIRKELFDAISGFDEAMPIYGEDYDLCARIYVAGHKIYYNKEVKVFHQHRKDLLSTWQQSYGFGTGHTTLLKKHFRRMLIIEAPRFRYISKKWPSRVWLDVASADKKFMVCLILSGIWGPFFIVLISYLILLYHEIGVRAKKDRISASFHERWGMVFLLLFKSLAISSGRVTGSFKHGVVCF